MCCCSDPGGRGVSVGEQSSTSTHSRGGGVWCRVFFCGACSESVMRRSGTTGAARSVGAHTETEEREAHDPVQVFSLHLKPNKGVRFRSDVVDNEGMGKKISKKCCIYHKKKRWNESDSEEDSDSEEESGNSSHHHHSHCCGKAGVGGAGPASNSSSSSSGV